MASPQSRAQGIENLPTGKAGKTSHMANPSPKRKPLSELAANSRMSAPTTPGFGKQKTTQSPLKRGTIDILDDDRGFQYLKRRKIVEPRPVPGDVYRAAGDIPVNAKDAARVRSETARFRPAVGVPAKQSSFAPVNAAKASGTTTEVESPEEEDDSGRESQHSFGSLINYEPSSQQAAQGPFGGPRSAVKAHYHRREPRPTPGATQAEVLRLRLKVAMYKVKTNQIYTPFSKLRVYRPAGWKPPVVRRASSPDSERESSEEPELPTRRRSPLSSRGHPGLMPAPILRPTAPSSRLVFGPPISSLRAQSAEGLSRGSITPARTYYGERRAETAEPSRVRHSSESETTIVYGEQSTPAAGSDTTPRQVSMTPQPLAT